MSREQRERGRGKVRDDNQNPHQNDEYTSWMDSDEITLIFLYKELKKIMPFLQIQMIYISIY